MTLRRITLATAVCGTLDLLYAFAASALLNGTPPADVLRGVATGPFGDAASTWGAKGAFLGGLTHYAIMAVMVAVGLALFARKPFSTMHWLVAGTLYGLAIYLVMYGAVLPARFGVPFPNPDMMKLAIWALPHWLCVSWPLAWMDRKSADQANARDFLSN